MPIVVQSGKASAQALAGFTEDSLDVAQSGLPRNVTQLIFLPALITLAVTLLRAIGELQHWSKTWFNPDPGGFLALVGIVWLVPVFGVYFALKLRAAGERPPSVGHAVGHAVVGLVVLAAGFYLFQGVLRNVAGLVVMWILAALAAVLQFPTWPALFRTLAAYAYAARIPVAVVMLLATAANWRSHYSTAVPGNSRVVTYVLYGLIPQLVFWVSFTIVLGSLFATVAVALFGRRFEGPSTEPAI